MAIREVIRDTSGKASYKTVPGYEDPKPKTTVKPSKEIQMKTKPAVKKPMPKAVKEKLKADRAPKSAFKYAIMALNGDNVYSKKNQAEVEADDQLLQAFKKWLSSEETGEFIAIRRK